MSEEKRTEHVFFSVAADRCSSSRRVHAAPMPHHVIFDEHEGFDEIRFREESFQLEAFRTLNFDVAMKGELAKVFTEPGNIKLRNLGLIERICNERAAQYIKRPTRKFQAGSPAQEAKLEAIYKASGMDRALLMAQQQQFGQNAVVICVDQAPGPLRVKTNTFISGEVHVESKDLLLDDLRDADKVTLRVPIRRELHGVTFGRRIYTKDEAYTESFGGEKVGLFRDDLVNPLGYIPCILSSVTEPRKGHVLPALPQDMLSVQIGLIIGLSDIENICRMKVPGREVVTGANARMQADKMFAGPEGMILLDGDEIAYQAHSIDPRIDRYFEYLSTMLRLLATYKYVSAEGLWASTGITGDAKEVEFREQLEDRHRQETLWQDTEQQLVEVVSDVARTGPSALTVQAPQVTVDYHYVKPRKNDLQTAQATALRQAMGLDASVQEIMEQNNMTRDEAVAHWQKNLESYREWREMIRETGGTPPGLDAIATQVMGE